MITGTAHEWSSLHFFVSKYGRVPSIDFLILPFYSLP
jgi:hypothetical protein